MSLNDEISSAVCAALAELFRQYPIPQPDRDFLSDRRDTAIRLALNGYITSAIDWAMNTGVPDDVLTALRVLLDG